MTLQGPARDYTDHNRQRHSFGRVGDDLRPRWLRWRNDDATTCPAYGVIRPTGAAAISNTPVRVVTGARPNATQRDFYYVNWGREVPFEKSGWCTLDPVDVAYDTAAAPAFHEIWGPTSGQWTIKKGKSGFRIIGGATSGRVLALQMPPVPSTIVSFANMYLATAQTFTTSGDQVINLLGAQSYGGCTTNDSTHKITTSPAGLYSVWGKASALSGAASKVAYLKLSVGTPTEYSPNYRGELHSLVAPTANMQADSLLGIVNAADGDQWQLTFSPVTAATWTLYWAQLMMVRLADAP